MHNGHPDLMPYLDGELTPLQAQAVAQHLRTCDACQRELAALQAMRALLQRVPAPTPHATPAEFAARLPERRAAAPGGPVLIPLALAFLTWSAITAFFILLNGLSKLPFVAPWLPNPGDVWWIALLRPLLDLPIVQMVGRVITLGGWLGWDDWAFLAVSLTWALVSAGLLALDWAWTRHRVQVA